VKDLLAMTRKRDVERRVATTSMTSSATSHATRRYALETAGIVCTVELEPALPLVQGDRAQLEQVMMNLLSNAEQALTQDAQARVAAARVTVRTRHDQNEVVIEIEDNGPAFRERTPPGSGSILDDEGRR